MHYYKLVYHKQQRQTEFSAENDFEAKLFAKIRYKAPEGAFSLFRITGKLQDPNNRTVLKGVKL